MFDAKYLFYISIFILLFSCHPIDDVSPVHSTTVNTGLFASGEINEPGQSYYYPFKIDLGIIEGEAEHIFWHEDVSEGELGSTIIIGAFPLSFAGRSPLFGLQFWGDDLPGNRQWTSEELEAFFQPGKSFDFGLGVGRVDLSLKMPIGGPYDLRSSKSSYLVDPQGELTIRDIQDYDFPSFKSSGRSFGKLIRCTFAGEIGRYDIAADQADGNPDIFITDEVVDIKNGEALFYVEYATQ